MVSKSSRSEIAQLTKERDDARQQAETAEIQVARSAAVSLPRPPAPAPR